MAKLVSEISTKNISQRQILFFLLLCIPLFLINIKNSHDWGDDFAQYLHQSKNILQGIPAYDTGYIYNERFPFLGPPAYPPGFPLLLAPITLFANSTILPYSILITVFLVLTGVTLFYFFSGFVEILPAGIFSLILIYNPWILHFKSEVVSDIPFTFFLFFALLLFERRKNTTSYIISLGLLLGFICCIRWVGVVLSIALFPFLFFRFLKNRTQANKYQLLNFGILVPLISVIFYVVMNYFIFPVNAPGSANGNQLQILFSKVSVDSLMLNLTNYSLLIRNFFCYPSQEFWSVPARYAGNILFIGGLAGWTISILKKHELKDWFFVLYAVLLIIYPYGSSGLRFLIPVIPLLLIYTFEIFRQFLPFTTLKTPAFLGWMIICFFMYRSEVKKIISEKNMVILGPYRIDAQAMFSYISRNTKNTDRILFIKPRALSYYTNRSAFANLPKEDQQHFNQQLKVNALNYLLNDTEMPNPALTEFLKDSTRSELQYQIGAFYFYQLKTKTYE
ncbi:hypothetical protein BH11BAC2_BH11BAC2_21870 [soil metagenome]